MDFKNQNMAWYIIEQCLRIMIDNKLDPKEDNFYAEGNRLPSDVLKIYQRIISGQVDA